MRIIVVVATLALGGCAVVSETPLFGPQDASAHPLASGLWAMSGPGCNVGPLAAGQRLPECALPVSVVDGRMDWSGARAAQVDAFGPGLGAALPHTATDSAVELVDGDPSILEVLNGQPNPVDHTPTKPGYVAIRPLGQNASGEVNWAILWFILCPKGGNAPGFEMIAGKCIAKTPQAVRAQAKHMPPLMSYYLTWVRR